METVRFGELYSIPSSNGLSRPSAVRGEGYKMVNMGELFAYDIIRDVPMDRVQMSAKELDKFLIEENDLLFARQSLVAEGAGKCSIVSELSEPTTFESHLIRVRLKKDRCNPWYYYYLFKLANNPIKAIVNQCAQAGIRGNELQRVKVQLPEKDYQDKIVAILRPYDELIETNNKRITILEQMAENLYKEWFVRFRFPGHENAEFENGIPKKWRKRKLGEFIDFTRGVSYGSDDISEGDATLLSMNNIRPYGGFIEDYTRPFSGKYKANQRVHSMDIIMSVTDMTQDRRIIGYTALVPPSNIDRIISMHLLILRSKEYPSVFLNGLFNYSGLSRVIAERATGTNVLGLTTSILEKVRCYIPTEEIIMEYEKHVMPIYSLIFTISEQNNILSKQCDLLLPRLMSGKLQVK